jgi:hypothetical protein
MASIYQQLALGPSTLVALRCNQTHQTNTTGGARRRAALDRGARPHPGPAPRRGNSLPLLRPSRRRLPRGFRGPRRRPARRAGQHGRGGGRGAAAGRVCGRGKASGAGGVVPPCSLCSPSNVRRVCVCMCAVLVCLFWTCVCQAMMYQMLTATTSLPLSQLQGKGDRGSAARGSRRRRPPLLRLVRRRRGPDAAPPRRAPPPPSMGAAAAAAAAAQGAAAAHPGPPPAAARLGAGGVPRARPRRGR